MCVPVSSVRTHGQYTEIITPGCVALIFVAQIPEASVMLGGLGGG